MYLYIKMLKLEILSLDHVGFPVHDVERSLHFYSGVLGLPSERVDAFRAGRVPFPSVRINETTIIDLFPPSFIRRAPGGGNVDHIALTLSNTPGQIRAYLLENNVPIVKEMTGNFGAEGDTAHAFHVTDPDGNMIELHAYV